MVFSQVLMILNLEIADLYNEILARGGNETAKQSIIADFGGARKGNESSLFTLVRNIRLAKKDANSSVNI